MFVGSLPLVELLFYVGALEFAPTSHIAVGLNQAYFVITAFSSRDVTISLVHRLEALYLPRRPFC